MSEKLNHKYVSTVCASESMTDHPDAAGNIRYISDSYPVTVKNGEVFTR